MRRSDVSTYSVADQVNADSVSASAASVGSSPRSLSAGKGSFSEEGQVAVKWDEAPSPRVKLMCSNGGRILPRPHDNQLRYVGGDTRMVVVSRVITYGDFTSKLVKLFGASLAIKYQLPNEDLDALISVKSEEDLDNMMEEYDKLQLAGNRCSRLRLFLFPAKLESQMSLSDLFENNQNRETWFVDALNGIPILPRVQSESSSIVSDQTLEGSFGLDEWAAASNYASNSTERAAEKPSVSVSTFQLQSPPQTFSPAEFPVKTISTARLAYSAPPAVPSMVPSSVVDAASFKGQPTTPGTWVDNELLHVRHADGRLQVFTTTPYAFIQAANESPDQRAAGSTDDDPGLETGSSPGKARTGSEEKPVAKQISVAPPMGQQLSEAPMQLAKSNTTNKDLESGITKQDGRIIVSGDEEVLVVISEESTTKALDAEELQVLGGNSDDRRNKLEPSETQQVNTSEFRAPDAAIRTGSSNNASPEASKSGESVTMQQQVLSSNTKETREQEQDSPIETSSSLNPAVLIQSDPGQLAFYSQEDEIPSISPTYATQGPVIQLPIEFSTLASSALAPSPAAGEAPPVCGTNTQLTPAPRYVSPQVLTMPPQPLVSSPSAQLAPASNPVSPPLLAVPPQAQLRRVQAPSPSPAPVTDASSPASPTVVYHSTAAYIEGLTAGIPMYSPTAQLQRHISDPVAQHQVVPSSQKDYQAATANNAGPSMLALPSRFRGHPALISNQQPLPIGSDRKPVGMWQAVSSPRPPLVPAQYIYNIEQRHTYPAAAIPTAAVYDPTIGAYALAPTNLVLTSPDSLPFAAVNRLVDEIRPTPSSDVSSFARST